MNYYFYSRTPHVLRSSFQRLCNPCNIPTGIVLHCPNCYIKDLRNKFYWPIKCTLLTATWYSTYISKWLIMTTSFLRLIPQRPTEDLFSFMLYKQACFCRLNACSHSVHLQIWFLLNKALNRDWTYLIKVPSWTSHKQQVRTMKACRLAASEAHFPLWNCLTMEFHLNLKLGTWQRNKNKLLGTRKMG